jgi:hypothetical protein
MARDARKATGASGWKDTDFTLNTDKTIFTGYNKLEDDAEVIALVVGSEQVNAMNEGQSGIVVLDKTPCAVIINKSLTATPIVLSPTSNPINLSIETSHNFDIKIRAFTRAIAA